MDLVEMVAVIIGSAILVAMISIIGRRSWLDRRETKEEIAQRHSSKAMAA